MTECDVDSIIDQLLGVRGARPGRQVNLTESEIRWLCVKGRDIFQSQPVLLELEAPIKVSDEQCYFSGILWNTEIFHFLY